MKNSVLLLETFIAWKQALKYCKCIFAQIVSNVKICVDSKSAKENSVIIICMSGWNLAIPSSTPTKKYWCLIIYHIELIDVIEGHKVLSTPQHTQYYIAKPNYQTFIFS